MTAGAASKLRGLHLNRSLSTRASTILSTLGIPTTSELSGVYDGQWRGSGEVFESVCPTTGEILARVKSVSCHCILSIENRYIERKTGYTSRA